MCWKFVTELEVCGLVKDNTEEKKLLYGLAAWLSG